VLVGDTMRGGCGRPAREAFGAGIRPHILVWRQERARGRHLVTFGLPLRRVARHLHLPQEAAKQTGTFPSAGQKAEEVSPSSILATAMPASAWRPSETR
jgi:hypothetical protein